MRNILVVPVCVAVAACATPVAEPEPAASVQATEPMRTVEPTQAAKPVQVTESVQAAQRRETEMVADNNSSKEMSGIEELEAPGVEQVPPTMIPGRVVSEEPVVCERVIPTGSILPTKVCRDRRYMEAKEEADREIFDDIKRNTAIGNTRL